MKTSMRRVISLLLVLLVCFSFVTTVYAATTVTQVKHTSPIYGGSSGTTVFYVSAEDTGKTKLYYSCTKGRLFTGVESDGDETYKSIYGYYEIRVWGKKGSSWVELTKYKENIKNDFSGYIDMKGYTEYKVQIYSWKTSTISSYRNEDYSKARWNDFYRPTITFSSGASTNGAVFSR